MENRQEVIKAFREARGVVPTLVPERQLCKFHAGMKRRISDRLTGLSGPCHPFNK